MDKCTFGYIEDKFRLTDPEKADYFNNLALNIWKQITDSLLFKKVVEVTPRYYLSPLKTQKRNKQLKLIEDINNELPEPVVKISNSDLVMVNVSPLFGQETSINAENLTKLNLSKPDITKYLNEGLSVKNSILQKIHDEYLTGKPTYVQNVDKDQNLIPGSYRLNYQSDKIKGKKNTKVAATNIVNSVKDKIETDYPGVIVTPNYDTTYITFKVAPGPDLLSQYETPTETLVETPTETLIETPVLKRGELDKNIRTKYFAEEETTTDKEILTKIANSSHPLNQLAKHLIKYTKGVSVKLVPEIIVIDPQTNKEKNSAGLYKQIDLFTEEIQINEFVRFRGMGVEPTIIHEVLHSLSVTWLNNINQKDPLYLEFKKYYSEALQTKELQSLNKTDGYGLANEREFLVALFTDAKLISALKEIPASEPTKYKNRLEEIFNFILLLFKIKENSSIYSEAFAVASNIIEEQFDLENKLIDNLKPYSDDLFENYNLEESFDSGLKDYKPSELKVSIETKPGVEELFSSNPELAKIGTPEQYSKYLDSIFPENKIEYRGDSFNLEKFKYSESLTLADDGVTVVNKNKLGSGVYTTPNLKFSQDFAKDNNGKLYSVLVNTQNELKFNSRLDFLKAVSFYYNLGSKAPSAQQVDNFTKTQQKNNISIFVKKVGVTDETVSPIENTYILGVPKDIEGFKEFMQSNSVSIVARPIVEELKTTLIPDNIEEQFAEAKKLENKTPENNEEFNKKILYSLILPNISYDKFLNVFSQTNPEEFNKYREEKVKKIIDSFVKKFNITVETISTFQDRYAIANNKTVSYNGVANLANKTIKYLDGDNNALTEEVAHFMVAMLDKNGPEYLALKNYITQTEEYQLYYDSYLEVYNGDVDKTEEEIMGKVVANSLLGISEQTPLSLKSIIKQIFNKLKEFLTPQYKREFTKALDNINHLFFTENFDTAFNEANITFDEFYKLDFLNVENEIKFNKSTDQIINTITTNLERQKVKFIQNKQTELVNKTTLLIKILNSEDSDIDNIEKIKDFISLSVLEIQNLKNSFEEFENSGVIKDLESKDFSKLSRQEQEAQTNQDRLNNLNYIASAISTIQNLYSFIQLIEENFTSMNRDLQSLKDFKEIVESLPNTQENNSFKSALSFTYPTKKEAAISELKGVYENISKQLLKVVFNSLSTAEQKEFLKITKLDPITNVVEANDIKTEINIFSTIKDYFLGRFSQSKASTAYKATRANIMPISFQSDIFLLSIDNANAAIRQIKLMNTTKEIYETDLLQTDLQVLGDFDQTFVSAKDKNGKVNFKLLQKYNYLQFGNTLTNKIVNSHLIPLIQSNFKSLNSGILKGTSEDLVKVLQKNITSPKNLKLSISKLFENTVISKNLYYFLLNYAKAYELLYTLKLSQSNPNLSDINYQNLTQYQNEYIAQLENKLTNLNFTEDRLPYLNINFDFQNSSLTELQIIDVVHNVVNNKREKIIKKEVTIPEMVNGNPNPVYYNQLGYAEGLLNFFKQKINFVENLEGDVNIDLVNFTTLGDELFFNLSDKNQVSGIDYIDQDYIKLEKESKDTTNSRTQKIAETKLKIIKKIQDFNNENNLKSNYLKKKFKYNNSQFLSDDLNKRNFLNYIFRIIPAVALTVGLTNNIFYAPVIYSFSQIGIDQLIKISYFIRKNNFNVIKALQLYFNSSLKEELRVEDYDVEVKTNEEKSLFKAFKQIFTTLRNKVESKFLNNTDDSEVIDTNTFLVGETEIPKPFAKVKADNSQLSTDFLADYKTFVQEMANYETNVRWESWIRMAGEYQAIREGFNSLNIINLIKDRFFFSKFYNKNSITNVIRILTTNFARKTLTGNIQSQIMNFVLGNLTTLIHTNPINFAKAFVINLKDVTNKLFSATNATNLYNDFLNIFTGSNSEKNRLAFFQTLADTFLGKNTTLIQERNNLSTHIKKYLKNQRGTGFTVFDESENYLISITQSTNSQGLQQVTENFITTLLINNYFLDNPLVDEFNNPIKNLQTYLSLENGKIILNKEKLGITKLYLQNDNKLKVKSYDNIDIENNKGFSEMTLEELNVDPLTDLELEIFLNETMLNEISNLQEKSQGVYNIFNKSYWRNSWLGLLLLQFRDHVLPALTTTINSKKISTDFTNYEKGIINSLSSLVSRTVKRNNFNKDSYQNALLLSNLDYRIILRDNAIMRFILKNTLNTNIDKKLKELAKDNINYRKLVKKELAVNLLNNINKLTYIQKFENKSNSELEKNIKLYFNTTNSKKVEILKKLINDKFTDLKGTLNIKSLEELNKVEIQENYSEILENYNKLQSELSGDIKALNRLSNLTVVLGLLILVGILSKVFQPADDEDEEEKLKNYSWYDYLLILGENVTSNLIANYMPIMELGAYGYDNKTGKFDTNKALLVVGDLRRIFNTLEFDWADDETVATSKKKIKEREEILKLTGGKVPLLPPTLKEDEYGFYYLENNIEFKESLLKLTIPKGVSDNFEIFKNKKDLEKYEKQKDLNFQQLLTLNAKNQKFAKFYGIYIDPDKQEERDKELEKSNERIEALQEENQNIEDNNK